MSNAINEQWQDICGMDDLTPDTGVCALYTSAQGVQEQVAIFLESISGDLYAVSNYDPFGDANVISRGIIGSIKGQLVVASPLYKQHFDLQTGVCLEEPTQSLTPYHIRQQAGRIEVAAKS